MIDAIARGDHHQLAVHEVVLLLETDASEGLSRQEARNRRERFGPNVLPRLERRGPIRRFLAQFHHPLIYILLVAAGLTALLGHAVDASVIAGVVLVNAAIGFIQESRAEHALEALVAMVRTEATVIRDNERMIVHSSEVVPGDLAVLGAGDKVPADLRLVGALELRIDESALTGESVPAVKTPLELPLETALAERENMAYSGTLVVAGQGQGIAVGTGADTEIGHIHRLVGAATGVDTPLTRKITHFSRILTFVILGLAALSFMVGLARGEAWGDMVNAAVALAVGAIPEGLPAAVTITLAIGVSRMARRHAIVRKLPAVETLGSTTVICTDKTGTLTENQMTVQVIVAGGESFAVTGTGYAPAGEFRKHDEAITVDEHAALRECLLAGVLCNDARVVESTDGWDVVGDPTEGALIVAARKGGIDPDIAVRFAPRVDTIPFESENQYMATIHRTTANPRVIYVKGAAEKVLALCNTRLDEDGAVSPLDARAVLRETEMLAARALRVLAFARASAEGTFDGLRDGLAGGAGFTLIGLQAMADPPRPEAIAAVKACRDAGIEVKMITGDHAGTAAAIGARIGLNDTADGTRPPVLTGAEITACPPDELPDVIDRTTVFARVSPEQKLRLVEGLQRRRHIVAMTGDGVNDAPALKQADIGIAMGRAGTEVAKETADMILTDDNFASIEAAVEEGRGVFDNLTKFIVWTLPTNMGEGLVILAAILAGSALPILPVQILWINMTTAVSLGLTLAFEPKEVGIMQRRPRDPDRPLLTLELVVRILLVSAFLVIAAFTLFHWEQHRGAPIAEARTVAVNCFVMVELTYLFNCRSLDRSFLSVGIFTNRVLLAGVLTTIGLQIAFTYAPFMQSLFHSTALDGPAWIRIAVVAIAGYTLIEAEKAVRRNHRRRAIDHNYRDTGSATPRP
jgi:magnesium-transporting ATPase (P-type)